MASELEKELLIQEFSQSSNFADTQSSVAKLSKYTEFTAVQINELLESALSNTQIKWIIQDEDVKQFIASILDAMKIKSMKKVWKI